MIEWGQRAALYLDDEVYVTGTLSDLAYLYGDLNKWQRTAAFIGGDGLPKLAEDDRSYKIGPAGLVRLRSEFLITHGEAV